MTICFRRMVPTSNGSSTAAGMIGSLITHNQRIRYTPNELAAVVRHRVALLVMIGHAPFPELAHNFVKTLPRIEAFVEARKPPFIAKVYRSPRGDAAGSIALWYTA